MATITEDYVSFETAKLLKEKGFDEPCYMAYVPTNRKHIMRNDAGHSNSMHPDDYYAVPTLQMAMKWLREVHNVFISITYEKWDEVFIADVKSPVTGIDCWVGNKHNCWFKYEEAAEEAIKFCLERII